MADAASFQEGDHPLFPDLVLPVYDALFQFVGAHPVYALHKDVSEYRSVDDALDQRKGKLEPGLLSRPLKLAEITGTCSMPAFFSARRIKAI